MRLVNNIHFKYQDIKWNAWSMLLNANNLCALSHSLASPHNSFSYLDMTKMCTVPVIYLEYTLINHFVDVNRLYSFIQSPEYQKYISD